MATNISELKQKHYHRWNDVQLLGDYALLLHSRNYMWLYDTESETAIDSKILDVRLRSNPG